MSHLVVQPIGGGGGDGGGSSPSTLNLTASGTSTGVVAITSSSTASTGSAATTTLPKVPPSSSSSSSSSPAPTRTTAKTTASSQNTPSSSSSASASTAASAPTASAKLPQIHLKSGSTSTKSTARVRIDEQSVANTSSAASPNHVANASDSTSDTSRSSSTKDSRLVKRSTATSSTSTSTKPSPRLVVHTDSNGGGANSNGASPRSPRSAKSSARGISAVRSPHRTPGTQSPLQSPLRPRTLDEILGFFPNVAPNSSQLVSAALTNATSLLSPSAASAILNFGQGPPAGAAGAPADNSAAAALGANTGGIAALTLNGAILRPPSAPNPPILTATTSEPLPSSSSSATLDESRYIPPCASSVETDHLVLAIQANRADVVLALIMKQPIEWRCDFVNSYDENGCTGLFYALAPERLDCIQLLLDFGADVNHINNKKNTCLHVACVYNYKKAIKTLIEYGANPQRENWEHQMPHQMLKTSEKQSQMLNYINTCREQHNQNLADKKYVPVDRYIRSYYRSMYELMDVKHVNALTQEVLQPMLDGWKKGELQEGESKEADPQFFKQWFTQSDLDKNGVLSFAEFLMAMVSLVAERDKALKKAKKLAMMKAKKALAAGGAGGAAKKDGFASPSVLSP